jgi:hypothetical protein
MNQIYEYGRKSSEIARPLQLTRHVAEKRITADDAQQRAKHPSTKINKGTC